MYRGRLWTMRQFAGFGRPADTNRRFRFLLDEGQTGLSTAFDLPTLMGLDSDDPRWRCDIDEEHLERRVVNRPTRATGDFDFGDPLPSPEVHDRY